MASSPTIGEFVGFGNYVPAYPYGKTRQIVKRLQELVNDINNGPTSEEFEDYQSDLQWNLSYVEDAIAIIEEYENFDNDITDREDEIYARFTEEELADFEQAQVVNKLKNG